MINSDNTFYFNKPVRPGHALSILSLATAMTFTFFLPSDIQAAEAARPDVKSARKIQKKQFRHIKNRRSGRHKKSISLAQHGYPAGNSLSCLSGFTPVAGPGGRLPECLRPASDNVQVGCLKPELLSLLDTIQNKFQRPVIITSGYRSADHNHKVNGVKGSLHMSCAAADIKVPGVSKWAVANFVRSIPERGGVGTYCAQIIHVDIGAKRDWNRSCSRKR